MEVELPCHRNCLELLMLKIFAKLKQHKITFGLDLGQHFVPEKLCKDNKKAVTVTRD